MRDQTAKQIKMQDYLHTVFNRKKPHKKYNTDLCSYQILKIQNFFFFAC